MSFDASHLFPHDHFQLQVVQARDEHRLVLRCSEDFLDPYAAKRTRLNQGRRARELRNQIKTRLHPENASDPRYFSRFMDQLNEWALLPHNFSGKTYDAREARAYAAVRGQIPSSSPAVEKLLADYARAYREHVLAGLRTEALAKLGGSPASSAAEVQAGFLRHFNRLLNPSRTRPEEERRIAEGLGRRLKEARTPTGLVGYYPPLETLSDLQSHYRYFSSDFKRVRDSGLQPDSAFQSIAPAPEGSFILTLPLSGPTVRKDVLFHRLQDALARSLQRMGFPVRVMPPE